MLDVEAVGALVRSRAPTLTLMLGELLPAWTTPIKENLGRRKSKEGFPKTVNDAVWGVIELFLWEVAILDSPLAQRLGVFDSSASPIQSIRVQFIVGWSTAWGLLRPPTE